MAARLAKLNEAMNDQDFWQDKKRSEETLREISAVKSRLEPVKALDQRISDSVELLELAKDENDESLVEDVESDLKRLMEELAHQEINTLFSGPDDGRDAILTIHPGAGGTESQDWAEMLLRMYIRYAEKKGFQAKALDVAPGDEAGIKSASVEVRGTNVFGHLKSESGVHRLVRISPFDASSRRHTSFASVFVYPEIDEDIEVEIRDEDLQVDTYRASGAGGQHVNKTDSAVRVTHKPSGIVVQCQSERSQHRNRDNAMKILRAKLYHKKLQEEREKFDKIMQSQTEIAWGNQIRSYVLHPYNMVKDHRTEEQTSDVQRVLDGDLSAFIEAYLHKFTTG
jgi:peptide chain release factor 2